MEGTYKDLIDGRQFDTSDGETWIAEVLNNPDAGLYNSENLNYRIEFTGPDVRLLNLTTSTAMMYDSPTLGEKATQELYNVITTWLESEDMSGQLDIRKF